MLKFKKIINKIRRLSLGIFTLALSIFSMAQCPTNIEVLDKVKAIEVSSSLSFKEKLEDLYALKKKFSNCSLPKDSVYARILHRTGSFEYSNNNDLATAIEYTLEAVRINTAAQKNSSAYFVTNSFYNLGFYYEKLQLFDKALIYYDSSIYYAYNTKQVNLIPDSRQKKAFIYFVKGDYQKGIEESTIGLIEARKNNDISLASALYNQRAQSYLYQNEFSLAFADSDSAIMSDKLFHDQFQLCSAYKTMALASAKQRNFHLADSLFKIAIQERKKTRDFSQISDDYTDYGNFYLNEYLNFTKARLCYLSTIDYALLANDHEKLAKAYINLGQAYFREFNYNRSEIYYVKAMQELELIKGNNFLENPTSKQLNLIGNKELLLGMLDNKTELLLHLFKTTGDKKYLAITLSTSLLTDSVITQTRHEQIGEQSKLYWRNRTKEFYEFAMEASFLANSASNAFYFMEKSRAVLLNDKLNELGASAYLPKDLQLYEQNLRFNLIGQQQKLESLIEGTTEYDQQYQQYLEKKSAFENYIKSLEKNYPAYYQYKYADSVPPLKALQEYLKKNNQAFIHYFISDSVVYILGISATTTTMIKHPVRNYNDSLGNFMQLCADESMLNKNYSLFATYANHIYKTIFKDLNIPAGRVVICPDNFLVPFEALCRDNNGEKFLAYDYAFSYVYSASFLLKKFKDNRGKGNFLGLAPVNFSNNNHLPSLVNSDKFLKTSSGYYSGARLLTNNEATKNNFIAMLPQYEIVNVFSHAMADSSNSEPVLFLFDSSVRLSELQKIINPSTKMVVLSACQTSVGRNATGEGIYSLARGFAAAGIPSVAATLWKADDLTIYDITQRFNEQISKGVRKDDALQQAKLSFLQKAGTEKSLPYYWANMILVGNADPIVLDNSDSLWWYAGGTAMIVLMGLGFARRYRKKAA